MSRIEETIWCDGCGTEILWAPFVVGKHDYCCQDCYEGLKCDCGTRMDLEDDRRSGGETSIETLGGDLE